MTQDTISDVRNRWIYGQSTTEQAVDGLLALGYDRAGANKLVAWWATGLAHFGLTVRPTPDTPPPGAREGAP